MKQNFLSRRTAPLAAAFAVGLAGCATAPQRTSEPWPESRPLGKEYTAYRAPSLPSEAAAAVRFDEPRGEIALRQALAAALLKNPELASFSWEVRAAEARKLQASLRPNPEAGVEVENFAGSGEFRRFDSSETTIELSQLIELAGKRPKRTRVATLERDLAGWDYESKRLDVLTETAKAFVDTLAAQDRLAVLEGLVKLAQEVLNSISERVKAGKVSPAEEMRAGVALSTSRIELERTRRDLEAARRRLAAAWGSKSANFERVVGQLDQVKPIPSAEQLDALIAKNPDIARWATEVEQRRAALDLEKSKRIPNVTVAAGGRYHNETSDGAVVAGVSIPLPIFDRNQGAILEAQHNLSKAEAERRTAELGVYTALAESYQALSTAFVETTALKGDVLPKAQGAFEATRERYLQGKFAYVDVLDAQRTLFEVRTQYLEALAAYHKAVADVERLIGQPLDAVTKSTEQK